MPSLVIHAPKSQLGREGTKSFDDIFKTGIGKAYALNSTILGRMDASRRLRVVLLGKDIKRRAEGELVRVEPATKDGRPWFTKNHIRRYDVYVENFEEVPYRPEELNRNGVAVI